MYRKDAMMAAGDGPDTADHHDQQDLVGHAGFEGLGLHAGLNMAKQRRRDTGKRSC